MSTGLHQYYDNEGVLVRAQVISPLTGDAGKVLYTGLRDVLYEAPGRWSLRISDIGDHMWIDPYPAVDEVSKLYSKYSTHDAPNLKFLRRSQRLKWWMRRASLAACAGYPGSWWQKAIGFVVSLLPLAKRSALQSAYWLKGPTGTLLDVGCGNGIFLKKMEMLGWQVEGVEFDPNSAQQARTLGLDVYLGRLVDANKPAESFDALTMIHVIEHLHDPRATFKESYRILRPGGRLLIVTPNIHSRGHKASGAFWRGLEPPRHLNLFSPQALIALGNECGFRLYLCRTLGRNYRSMLRSSEGIKAAYQNLEAPSEFRESLLEAISSPSPYGDGDEIVVILERI